MAGTHRRRLRSGKVITVRNPTRKGVRAHNRSSAPKRKATQRRMKTSGKQLAAGFKFGKGGRIVRDRDKSRVRKRRKAQRKR